MKKNIFTLFLTVFFMLPVLSQTAGIKKPAPEDKGIAVSLGVSLPIGAFSSTHLIGMGVDAAPSRHRSRLISPGKFAFTYNGGFAYYIGKKENVSGYPYQYPGYSFIHAFAGFFYKPYVKTGISLTAGPALGIYNGTTRFMIGSKLDASYHINSNIFLGPGLILMKEPGANAIWSLALRAGIIL